MLRDLRDLLERQRLLVVVGAGVSIGAARGGPMAEVASWEGLLRDGVRRCVDLGLANDKWRTSLLTEIELGVDPEGDPDALLAAAEKIARRLDAPNGGEYSRWLRETVGALTAHHSDVLSALASLGAPICTTNYDGLLEEATGLPTITWSDTSKVVRFLRGEKPAILHLHGHWDRPETIVFGTRSYEDILRSPAAQVLQQLQTLNRSLLFVGCGAGLADPNIGGLFRWFGEHFFSAEHRHYRLARAEEVQALREQHPPAQRIIVLSYGAAHADLAPFLRGLRPGPGPDGMPRPATIQVFADDLFAERDTELAEAERLLKEDRYEQAEQAARAAVARLEAIAKANAARDLALDKRLNRGRFFLGATLLCLQELAAGKELLQSVDPIHLTPRARIALSRGLAQAGALSAAEDLLPAGDTSEEVEDARTLIRIERGEVPQEPRTPLLRLRAAHKLLEQGCLAEAGRWALSAVPATEGDPLAAGSAASLLFCALQRTILELSSVRNPLPVVDRGEVIARIEALLGGLTRPGRELSRGQRVEVLKLGRTFYGLCHDPHCALAFDRDLEALGQARDPASPPELAEAGKLDDAMSLLSNEGSPFAARGQRAMLLRMAGRDAEADAEFLRLAEEFPDRALIEDACARIFLRRGQPQEALPHAERAFAQLPGRGQRLLLCQVRLWLGQTEAAWALLGAVEDRGDPQYLNARVRAAHRLNLPVRAQLDWNRRYVEAAGENPAGRLNLAVLLRQVDELDASRAEAWRAFELGGDTLDRDDLHRAAMLQITAERPDEMARDRIRRIAQRIKDRFPNDAEAEALRFDLLAPLGFPDPVDMEALVRAGKAVALPQDEAIEKVKQQQARSQALADLSLRLYLGGVVSAETLCESLGLRPSVYLSRTLFYQEREQVHLCPPPALPEAPARLPSGAQLLLGEMELLLLHHLGLLEPLRQALGDNGHLVLFRDVEQAIDHAPLASAWAQEDRRQVLRRKEALLGELLRHDKVQVEKTRLTEADVATAVARRYGVVDLSPPKEEAHFIGPRSFIETLGDAGALTAEMVARLQTSLPIDSARRPDLPSAVYIHPVLLELFHQERALLDILRALPGTVWVGPESLLRWRLEIEQLKTDIDATERAAALVRYVAASRRDGFLSPSIERPAHSLPQGTQGRGGLARDWLSIALGYRIALEGHPSRYLLTADYLVGTAFSPAQPAVLQSVLRWTQAEYEALAARVGATSNRVLGFPALLASLNLSEVKAHEVRLDLGRLGFGEALLPADLRKLYRDYRGLSGEIPRRILHRIEWMARRWDHPGALSAQVAISSLYGGTIASAFGGEEDATDRDSLPLALLQRAEELDGASAGALEVVLTHLAAETANHPGWSFEAEAGGEDMRLSDRSPMGRLWEFLAGWAGDGRRRGAMRRALVRALCALDRLYPDDGPPRERVGPVFLALAAGEPDTAPSGYLDGLTIHLSYADLAFGVLAVLSAGWKLQPLKDARIELVQQPSGRAYSVDLQDVIAHGVRLIEEDRICGAAQEFVYDYPLGRDGDVLRVQIWPEALVLRASEAAVRKMASGLARFYAPADGGLSGLWRQLADLPGDAGLRREVARRSATAPFRQVRADAMVLAGWLFPDGEPSLWDLREMLWAEAGKPTGEVDVDFLGRLHSRSQSDEVLLQSVEVPGPLAGVQARRLRHARDLDAEVDKAIRRIREPDSQPIGRLCGDLLFLRLCVAQCPIVRLSTGEVDLRKEVPLLLEQLVAAVRAEAQPDTLAAAEAGLLRRCAHLIEYKAHPVGVSSQEGLWLTYRLYQWLTAQLDKVSPEARRQALVTLSRDAPPPNPEERCGADLLNPFRFERARFDHRLAAVLYALRFMEDKGFQDAFLGLDPSLSAPLEEAAKVADLGSAASEGMIAALVELATRPFSAAEEACAGTTESCLGWSGPAAVPELALCALLALDAQALLRLSQDARLRWFLRLPSGAGQAGLHVITIQSLLTVAGGLARELEPQEREALRHGAATLPETLDSFERERLRAWVAIGLYGAGDIALQAEIWAFFAQHVAHEFAAFAFAHYLVALSFVEPERMEADVERMLALAGPAGVPARSFVSGLGRVLFLGPPRERQRSGDLLRRLAKDPRFENDEDMRRLIELLKL